MAELLFRTASPLSKSNGLSQLRNVLLIVIWTLKQQIVFKRILIAYYFHNIIHNTHVLVIFSHSIDQQSSQNSKKNEDYLFNLSWQIYREKWCFIYSMWPLISFQLHLKIIGYYQNCMSSMSTNVYMNFQRQHTLHRYVFALHEHVRHVSSSWNSSYLVTYF